MSREELSAFLRNLQLSLDGLQREVEGTIRRLPDTKREQLPQLLADCRRRLAKFGTEQLNELDVFAEEAGLQLEAAPGATGSGDEAEAEGGAAAGGTPYGVKLQSLQQRVASMGGIPALGACVLPRMTPGMRPNLNTTASPAAVEIMRGRMGGSDATPLRKMSSSEDDTTAHTPLVQLRATPQPASRLAGAPLGAVGGNSELQAAIQRRMQRLGSASPDKDETGAAAAANKAAC